MTMNYQKMNIASFQQRLKEGLYKGVTGARRAIGKADWGQAEREKAHAIVNKHFKVSAAEAGRAPRTTAPRVDGAKTTNQRTVASARATAGPTVSRSATTKALTPKTNSEIVELCGTANELVETIRKSAEVSTPSRPVLDQAVNVLFSCLELVAGALKGSSDPAKAAQIGRTVRELGHGVRPQSYISRRGEGDTEQNEESQSAAAAR